jgi:hypothetical protein
MDAAAQPTEDSILTEYLSCHEISSDRFTTGLFQNGITIYKQQIRALNLFYAMFKLGRLKPGQEICIIGGGVSGLTFAAAALRAGVRVLLLEKEQMFLHLQHGCDIRDVHPNLYSWPDKGALFPKAKLPLLSWKAGKASNVAKQILNSFYEITSVANIYSQNGKSSNDNDDPKDPPYIGCVNANITCDKLNTQETKGKRFTIIYDGTPLERDKPVMRDGVLGNGHYYREVDCIVYCTGFGIEVSCEIDGVTPSYWRNDQFGQTIIDRKSFFYISGTGDGALADLFRLKINDFSYDLFLSHYNSQENEPKVTEALLDIKNRIKDDPKIEPLEQYKLLFRIKDLLKPLAIFLEGRIRSKVKVTLVTEYKESHEIIDFRKVSFINGLIFFLLNEYNSSERVKGDERWFHPLVGRTERRRKEYGVDVKYKDSHKWKPIAKKNILMLRHGTNRFRAFDGTAISKDLVKQLKKKQDASEVFNSDLPLWTYESITTFFSLSGKRAFYTNETVSLCSSYISILSSLIDVFGRNSNSAELRPHHKLCLFRVIQADDTLNFQSITPYFGSEDWGKDFGKMVPSHKGLLAMSAALQEPVLLKYNKNDVEELNEILKLLDLKEDEIFKDSQSVLVVPILGKLEDTVAATNLLLCLDSELPEIFEKKDVLEAIFAATEGLINSINRSTGSKQMLMDDVLFNPIISINISQERNYNEIKTMKSYVRDNKALIRFKKLEFNRYHSFNVYHNDI